MAGRKKEDVKKGLIMTVQRERFAWRSFLSQVKSHRELSQKGNSHPR
jgi:hypothetical protein